MIGQSELRRQEYVGRINRITDYVREKIAGNLRLKTLARVTSVSPWHFHRIVRSVFGETFGACGRARRRRGWSTTLP